MNLFSFNYLLWGAEAEWHFVVAPLEDFTSFLKNEFGVNIFYEPFNFVPNNDQWDKISQNFLIERVIQKPGDLIITGINGFHWVRTPSRAIHLAFNKLFPSII